VQHGLEAAEEPANPASTRPSNIRRTFCAPAFITVLPRVTWPSPPIATVPSRRTQQIVVPWKRIVMGEL